MDTIELEASVRDSAQLAFSRSGGPGGQNVNKVNTRVELRLRLAELRGISDCERERIRTRLAHRLLTDDVLQVVVSEERSQAMNREIAFKRMISLIEEAQKPVKKRKPTKPGKGAIERRLNEKRQLSLRKRNRSPKNED